MRHFQEILAVYRKIDRYLSDAIIVATQSGDDRRQVRLERDQFLNNHAYFVLLFGQFEWSMNQRCAEAIRKRAVSADWSRRRGWDIYNPDDKRLSGLSFEDRVALLADRRGPVFRRIMSYYNIRNLAAHGEFHARDLDTLSLAAELQTLSGQLAP